MNSIALTPASSATVGELFPQAVREDLILEARLPKGQLACYVVEADCDPEMWGGVAAEFAFNVFDTDGETHMHGADSLREALQWICSRNWTRQ